MTIKEKKSSRGEVNRKERSSSKKMKMKKKVIGIQTMNKETK